MILYMPYRASMTIIDFIMKQPIQKLYIYRSAWLRNRKRNDGLLSCLSSGLWSPYPSGSGLWWLCSRSVGIWIVMMWVVRRLKNMEHFSYTPHAKDFYLEIVASLFNSRPLATVAMVRSVTRSETICHAYGPVDWWQSTTCNNMI